MTTPITDVASVELDSSWRSPSTTDLFEESVKSDAVEIGTDDKLVEGAVVRFANDELAPGARKLTGWTSVSFGSTSRSRTIEVGGSVDVTSGPRGGSERHRTECIATAASSSKGMASLISRFT